MTGQNENAKEEARKLLQELVNEWGWLHPVTSEGGECLFCGAFEGDNLAGSYHRTSYLIERAKKCITRLLVE